MYLISVYFDEKSNQIMQRYIAQIADKTGNTFMMDNNVPPHLTLCAIEARNADVLIPVFDALNHKLAAGEIRFVSVGQLFPYVIYAAPVLNEYLFNLSKTIFDSYKDLPDTGISRFYKPFSWLPHVTLGKTLDKEQMKRAFNVLQDRFVPFKAKVTEIGLAKVNPHKDLRRFELSFALQNREK